MSLLNVKNLSVGFKRSKDNDTIIVKDISFSLKKGETVALVGESGSGKSLTALSILGLLPYPTAFHPKGSILFDGMQLLNASEADLKKVRGLRIGMIFQDPMTALNPLHTIQQQIAEPMMIHLNLSKKKAFEKVPDLLALVGFDQTNNRLNAYPHQLSGGQRQRVMIAIALACKPDILIADEPTTALDVTIQATILDLILSLQKKLHMGLLLISHDLNLVSKMAQKVLVLKEGVVVEEGNTKQVLEHPRHAYTKQLIAAEPKGTPNPISPDAPVVFSINNLNVSYKKQGSLLRELFLFQKSEDFRAVESLSLTVHEGETIGIVGESGSGKTSTCFAALRLIESNGKIELLGQRIDNKPTSKLKSSRASLQVIFQDPFNSLNPRFCVEQLISEGLRLHYPNLSKQQQQEAVLNMLMEVGLNKDSLERYPHEFSGGQRQRIAIARALILKPKVLFLDEPTSALDRSIQAEILLLLKNLQQTYKLSYVIISHDLKVVQSLSHKVLVMKDGRVVEQGNTLDLFLNPKEAYTKKLIESAFL